MPLAIYLKNFAGTLATQATTAGKSDPSVALEYAGRMGNIADLLIQAFLSPTVAQKYKNQLPLIMTRLLQTIQALTKDPEREAHFNNYIVTVVQSIGGGLKEKDQPLTLIGAILLCEVVFTVLKPGNF